jgi:hypothetical protein
VSLQMGIFLIDLYNVMTDSEELTLRVLMSYIWSAYS